MSHLKNLSHWLEIAQHADWAIPHFNISTTDQLQTIVAVCTELKSPVIIGVSEGEVDFIGYNVVRDIVTFWQEKTGLPIFLNADHHHSLERAKQAIDAGFDSVNIDCSLKNETDNIAETRAVVEYGHSNPSTPLRVNVEGEIGALATQSSEIMEKKVKIDPATLTTPEQAKKFVALTGCDRLTPAVGNLHGLPKTGHKPHLDHKRIKEIYEAVTVPLTLHGGSGIPDSDIKKARRFFSNIHINTDLRVAYTLGVRSQIDNTTTPYKYLKPADEAMVKVIKKYLKLFGSSDKA